MKDKNTILWFSSFISQMFIKDKKPSQIYNEILMTDGENIKDVLSQLYDKYKDNFTVSKNRFIILLTNVLNAIQKNHSNVNFNCNQVTERFMNETMKPEKYNFEKMVYPLWLFTKNLYFKLLADGADKVYFLSREGQFMKKLFDAYQDSSVGPKIKTEYLCVSRASTFLGTLRDLEDEDFMGVLKQYPNLSLRTFCKNLSFSDEEIDNIANSFEYNFDMKIDCIVSSKAFKTLKKNNSFIKLYDKKRKKARELFIKYLKQLGYKNGDKLFIVDVGWKGTIQNNIQKILEDIDVEGYYLGLMHYAEIENYESKNAVLFEHSIIYRTPNCYLYNSNRSIFEMLLAADHGSTVCYDLNSNKEVVPVFNYEEKERELYLTKIKYILDNIFAKYEKLVDILNAPEYDFMKIERTINQKFFDLIFSPSKSEIEEYKSFYHFENFGVMNYSTFSAKQRVTFVRKIKNYINFRRFIRNDDTWQYLKLYNANMKLGIAFLYHYKKRVFKRMGVL